MKKWSIGNLWKKYKYVGLVVLAGIVLMVLPAGTSAPDPQKDSGGFSLEDTERRMEEHRPVSLWKISGIFLKQPD